MVQRWLAVGVGFLSLAGGVVFAIRGSQLWMAALILLLAVIALAVLIAWLDSEALPLLARQQHAPAHRLTAEPFAPFWLLVPAVAAIVVTGVTSANLDLPGTTNESIARRWVVSIVLLLLAAWWYPLVRMIRTIRGSGLTSLATPPIRSWGPWAGMIAIAALPRLLLLDRFPTVLDGDEAAFMVLAQAWQDGNLPNPFGTSFYTNPNLYSVAQGWIADIVGRDIAGHRMLSVLVGTIGVLAAWRLGRYLVGPLPAAMGAILLATLPLHLHLSRVALNNITDPTSLTLALLFLVRTVRYGRRGDAVVSGMMLGFGWYGYYGGRAFPVVILVVLAVLATDRRVGLVNAIRFGGWLAAGFLATAIPLIMHYRRVPAEFGSHMEMVSTFSLEGMRSDPANMIPLYLENLRNAVLYPLVSNNQGFFRNDSPYLGWPFVMLMAIGLAVWIVRMLRDRDVRQIACLVLPWLVLSGGIALTTPIAGQRILAVTPFLTLAAGTGLVLLARWVAMVPIPRWASVPHRLTAALAFRLVLVVVLAATSASHLRWMTSEDRQIANYGDYRMMAAWDLGWRISHADSARPEPAPVLFAGPPFMYGGGWPNLRFQVPDLDITDVEAPLAQGSAIPELPEGTVLVLVAERANERCAAEQIYAGATMAEIRARDGRLVYTVFYHDSPAGWSTAPTPAGTTFTVVSETSCEPGQA